MTQDTLTVSADDQYSVEGLLKQAKNAPDATTSARYHLQAANLLHQQGDNYKAQSVLSFIDYEAIPQNIQEQYMLIALSIAVSEADIENTNQLLSAIPPHFFERVPPETQRQAGEIKANAYNLTKQYLMAAKERINASALYSGNEYWDNHEMIWRSLSKTPTIELSQQQSSTKNYELDGWLQLATNIKQNQISLEQQLASLSLWVKEWPEHPAALKLPEELELLSTLPDRRPDSIALALPLTGPLSNAGKAVRDGFIATFYADKYHTDSNTEITFYDTHGRNFSSVYQEILGDNPDLIIGPLDKKSLSEISKMDSLSIPVLALNYLNESTHLSQLYQFGLSAEDEAIQLADKPVSYTHLTLPTIYSV